jgi:hypothetical protein
MSLPLPSLAEGIFKLNDLSAGGAGAGAAMAGAGGPGAGLIAGALKESLIDTLT